MKNLISRKPPEWLAGNAIKRLKLNSLGLLRGSSSGRRGVKPATFKWTQCGSLKKARGG